MTESEQEKAERLKKEREWIENNVSGGWDRSKKKTGMFTFHLQLGPVRISEDVDAERFRLSDPIETRKRVERSVFEQAAGLLWNGYTNLRAVEPEEKAD